jgi:hypothetical protein
MTVLRTKRDFEVYSRQRDNEPEPEYWEEDTEDFCDCPVLGFTVFHKLGCPVADPQE